MYLRIIGASPGRLARDRRDSAVRLPAAEGLGEELLHFRGGEPPELAAAAGALQQGHLEVAGAEVGVPVLGAL
jgi:hypothetical protein